MKKLLAILLVCAMAFVLVAACAADETPAATPTPAPEATPAPEPAPPADDQDDPPAAANGMSAEDVVVALIMHSPPPDSTLFDGSFNEGSYNGIMQFLQAHGLSESTNFMALYSGSADTPGRIDAINDAVTAGANVLVLPGFHFRESVYEAQDLFPDVKFVVLDVEPAAGPGEPARVEANTAAILFAEQYSGFLAGYAAVREGLRELGFVGGIAVPAVINFGHGFIQGAEFAAQELGLEPGDVTITYTYAGQFGPDPRFHTMAASWFAGGTEVIFAAAGGVGFNVFSAAEEAGGLAIGVDGDQSGASPTVITSAMKALGPAVNDMLTAFLNDTWRGGTFLYNATNSGVALPMQTSRFENFTQAQYDAIYAQLASGAITVSVDTSATMPSADANLSGLTVVTINEVS